MDFARGSRYTDDKAGMDKREGEFFSREALPPVSLGAVQPARELLLPSHQIMLKKPPAG
jgi:hypothetical protein